MSINKSQFEPPLPVKYTKLNDTTFQERCDRALPKEDAIKFLDDVMKE